MKVKFGHKFTKLNSTATSTVTVLLDLLLLLSVQNVKFIYFDRSNGFDLVRRASIVHKPNNYVLSDGYVNLIRTYLTNKYHTFAILEPSHRLRCDRLSCVPQGSALVFTRDICYVQGLSWTVV
jgi:hypothetical protein